ncbi:polymorphic toxin-type HINT domain-containing protein [Pseudalkalibacillus sp. Hm43]|uniref:polymorphic toxin-type HINT domain-containing protein n=1 Tax=Pseudalkalibacillus sp. Hm43 TaxID=3450742 RepID=UPI003F41F5A7
MKKSYKRWMKHITILLLFTVSFSFGFPTHYVAETLKSKDKVLQLGAGFDKGKELPKTELEEFAEELSKYYEDMDEQLDKKDLKTLKSLIRDAKKLIKTSSNDIDQEFNKHKDKVKNHKKAIERLSEYEAELNEKMAELDQLMTGLETLIDKKGSDFKNLQETDVEAIRAQLADIKELMAPEAPEFPIGNTLPNRDVNLEAKEPSLEGASLTAASIEGEAPAKEDLAETTETTFTEDIRETADSLDSALEIYEFVRNNVKFEPYYGSRKGATGTLQQLSGNDVDQASMLISLLRYKEIPARYVSGTVEVPMEKVTSWVGVENPKHAVETLASLGIPMATVIDQGKITAVRMEHTWVEAYVPYEDYRGAGDRTGEKVWVPLDPSFKQNMYQEGINVEEITGLDKDALLDITQNSGEESGDLNTVTNVDMNAIQTQINGATEKLEDYIKENGLEEASMEEVIGGWEIKEEKLGILPLTLPYKTIAIQDEYSAVSSDMSESVKFSIGGANPFGFNFPGEYDFSYEARAADLYGKRITLSWVPATEEDEQIIAEYGGIFNTPVYMIKVTPVLKMDGKDVATGKPVGMAYTQEFVMEFKAPGMVSEKVKNPVKAGAFYAVGLNYGKIAASELEQVEANLEQLKENVTAETMYTDEAIGEILNGVVKTYFGQLDTTRQLIAEQYEVSSNRLLTEAMTGYDLNVGYLFMSPARVAPGGMYIDVDRNVVSVVSEKGEKQDELSFMLAQGSIESAMEHGIYEQFLGIPSVSTIKVLEEANNRGIPIHTVTKQNISEVLPKLKVSNTIKNDISNAVNQGRIVTIPEENIQYYDWSGTGFIVMDPDSGAAGYMISGGTAGGSTSLAVDIAALVALIDNFIMIISAASLIASGTILGGILGVALAALTIYFMVELLNNMYAYYINGDSSAGDAIITEAILSIAGAIGGSVLAKIFPGLNKAVTELYQKVSQRIANKQIADRLANEFSEDFVLEVVEKSGTDSLSTADTLIKKLQNSNVSKELIERAGKEYGTDGLSDLQKLTDRGLTGSQITKILDEGIPLDDAVRLADHNIMPENYATHWINNGIESNAFVKALNQGFTLDELAKLSDLGFKPSHIEAIGIKTSEDLDNYLQMWKVACNCFTAGTKIMTDDGTKSIEDIEIGDLVLAKNTDTGEVAHKPVTRLFENQVDETYKLKIADETITTTSDHPFWIDGKGWVETSDLQVGDRIETHTGKYLPINQIHQIEEPATVYNFTVDGFHTYYVSDLGILVHNENCIDPYFYKDNVIGKTVDDTTSGTPSQRLGKNLLEAGIKQPEKIGDKSWQAHHIVPVGSKYTKEARDLLAKYNIKINSATNGVWLPNIPGYSKYFDPDWDGGMFIATHNGNHLRSYYKYVNERIIETVNRNLGGNEQEIADAIEDTLQVIRKELLTSKILLHSY